MADDQRHRVPASDQKLRLGGIKFSDAQVRMEFSSVTGCSGLVPILSGFAKHRINLHQFLFCGDAPGIVELHFSLEDYRQSKALISASLDVEGVQPDIRSPVGTLTLFPHESRMDKLLRVVSVARDPGTSVHTLCSSLSAFCMVVDLEQLDAAADALLQDFSLPEGHSPFRYEPSELDKKLSGGQGRVVETVARYWEPVIRIYGSNLKTGLTKITVSFSSDQRERVLLLLVDAGIERFEMVHLRSTGSGERFTLLMLFDAGSDHSGLEAVLTGLAGETDMECMVQHDMEMLFFHGPHFQDRYGVVYTAVSALASASMDISCVLCSGTGVHLVAERGGGSRMRAVLDEVFVVP